VFFNVPAERQAEFDDWYDQDHVATLMQAPEWLACRRFALEDAHPNAANRLALHYITDRSGLASEARQRARESEWRARLAEEAWFQGQYNLFDLHGRRFVGQS
jgi:hypothetical protein